MNAGTIRNLVTTLLELYIVVLIINQYQAFLWTRRNRFSAPKGKGHDFAKFSFLHFILQGWSHMILLNWAYVFGVTVNFFKYILLELHLFTFVLESRSAFDGWSFWRRATTFIFFSMNWKNLLKWKKCLTEISTMSERYSQILGFTILNIANIYRIWGWL